MTNRISLVTGATGHLGNNLVRALAARGETVRAGVRNLKNTEPFVGVNAEVVYAELTDKDSLRKALAGVDTLYQVAAVYKHWAKDPQREIIAPSINGTRNILEAAAEQGVKRVVYVSSTTTLDPNQPGKMDENGWRKDYMGNHYTQAKVESEKLAWQLARDLKLNLVSVLPGAIIGPPVFALSETMALLDNILNRSLPIAPDFRLNYVDVRDVAAAMITAAERERWGERYILAGERSLTFAQIYAIAREFVPERRTPPVPPRPIVMSIAQMMQFSSRFTGNAPALLPSMVRLWYGRDEAIDISKAKRDLSYSPRPVEESLRESFAYLLERARRMTAATLA